MAEDFPKKQKNTYDFSGNGIKILDMKILTATLLIIIVYLQYRLWAGDGSLAHVNRLESEIIKQTAENTRLKERNRRLAAEVEALKNGTEAIEAVARKELGLVKQGETLYKIVDEPRAR